MSRIGLNFKRDGLAFVLLAPLLVGLTPARRTAAFPEPRTTAVASPSQGHDLSALPLAAQASISAVLGRDDARYHMIEQGAQLHADNPKHALAVDFTPQGVELRSGTARWRLALSAYGYGQALNQVSEVPPNANANRVEYRRGSLTEWYLNGPLGLEQGFTLEAPPGARPSGEPLTLALEVSGEAQPTLDANGAGLTLPQADGRSALRYAGLSASDSDGRGLPAWLDMPGETQLRLRVDDAGARYPLLIDPIVQTVTRKAKLTASDGEGDDLFGFSVAIDGDTVVVGARDADVGGNLAQGAAYVFVEPESGWEGRFTETAKLTASDGAAKDWFGMSVAVSGDTVVVGRFAAAYKKWTCVYVEPPGGWGGNLTETARLKRVAQGFGVAVAIDGDTVVVGGLGHSAGVYVEPPGGWTGELNESATLFASDPGFDDRFQSVAISGDTVVVGVPTKKIGGNTWQGSAYVFVEPNGGWEGLLTESAKLRASDGQEDDDLGYSVAIDGDTVVAGAPLGHSAYVFVEPVGGWSDRRAETAKLTASDGESVGWSVAISGQAVVVGAPFDDPQGSAYVFVEPPDGWSGHLTETAKLKGSGGQFGHAMAMDGQTIVAGGAGYAIVFEVGS